MPWWRSRRAWNVAGKYLDTDCVLALTKESDWLKTIVEEIIACEEPLYTSILTVIECKLVIAREYGRNNMHNMNSRITGLGIELLPVDQKVERMSDQLLKKYNFLGIFDSIHASTAIINGLTLLSTDHIFPLMEELSVEDPRGPSTK
jgi:predicted nucleic acid-binding protein